MDVKVDITFYQGQSFLTAITFSIAVPGVIGLLSLGA